MSAFELVGIVLGNLPIIVSELNSYTKAIQRFRSYKRELKTLVLSLETERISLQNVCESLLVGIVPSTQIEIMIQKPLGELWDDANLKDKIRLKLWKSENVFEEIVRDVESAIGEMMKALDIGQDRKVQWIGGETLSRQFKKVSFIVKRENYQELLARIRDGVSSLQRLTAQNIELEPQRKRRSQGRLYGLNIIEGLQFRIAMSHKGMTKTGGVRQWKEIVMRPVCKSKPRASSSEEGKVRFASSTSRTQQMAVESITSEAVKSTCALGTIWGPMNPNNAQYIQDLCALMKKLDEQPVGKECGQIRDPNEASSILRAFSVNPPENNGDNGDWSLVPIRDIVKNQESNRRPLLYSDKIRLALAVASSVLQFHGTPWMSSATMGEIVVSQQDGSTSFHDAFIMANFPEHWPDDTKELALASASQSVLLAMGILLIELILGQSLDKFRVPRDGVPEAIADYETATMLLGRVNMVAGPGYCSAVQRCLGCDIYPSNVGSVDRSELYTDIVSLLEEDVKTMMG
ncbi:hypothetical protein PT974_01771 [Cladobotryum mycophilum]|uniref:DUF7580 domain-containing protein n=1 Tax=Cladobotryum mycophilum TaxID=491253 RepID=A0ABR0SX14_9HYPO